MKIHKGDRVRVMTGKSKGVTGRILKVDPKRERVLVEGANRVKRHEKVRPTQRGGQTGGITEKEAWIHVSNVRIISPDDDRPTRVAYRIDDNGKRRVCARTGVDL
jgi:large subunit ribosomal protein L24